jgi:hypothetical protein
LLRIVPTACGQAADIALATRARARRLGIAVRRVTLPCSEIAHRSRHCRHDRLSERSYLFTMSDITQPHEAWRLGGCGKHSLRTRRDPGWWSQTGSNRRPPACKAGALPTELWPLPDIGDQTSAMGKSLRARSLYPTTDLRKWWAWEDLNFRPHAYQARALTN